jgi:23S rRNA G2069 N7-methylase RlmK/C1962 C5-methylase RlmI
MIFAWSTKSPNFAPKSGDFGLQKSESPTKYTFAIVRLTLNKVKRNGIFIENLSEGNHHPVNVHFPEGAYLKGLV